MASIDNVAVNHLLITNINYALKHNASLLYVTLMKEELFNLASKELFMISCCFFD